MDENNISTELSPAETCNFRVGEHNVKKLTALWPKSRALHFSNKGVHIKQHGAKQLGDIKVNSA